MKTSFAKYTLLLLVSQVISSTAMATAFQISCVAEDKRVTLGVLIVSGKGSRGQFSIHNLPVDDLTSLGRGLFKNVEINLVNGSAILIFKGALDTATAQISGIKDLSQLEETAQGVATVDISVGADGYRIDEKELACTYIGQN